MNRNFLKNIIVAALATVIYQEYIVAGVSGTSKAFGIVVVYVFVIGVLEFFDGLIDCIRDRRKRIRILNKCKFTRYTEHLAETVETKRAKGKDEDYLKDFITNFITHQKRYAFSGEQIGELLSLAEDRKECAK